MEMKIVVVLLVVAVAVTVAVVRSLYFRITVMEYEIAVVFSNGRVKKQLGSGRYWIRGSYSDVIKCDNRIRVISVKGQEMLSKDGVSLKLTAVASYRVTDLMKALMSVQSMEEAVYLELQLASRQVIGSMDVDAMIENRAAVGDGITQIVAAKLEPIGLVLERADIKDIMLPGEMKEAFSKAVAMRKEAQALLERARGESAAMRNLANTARLLDGNASLMALRTLQVMESTKGNTYILGSPEQMFSKLNGASAKEPDQK